MQMRMVRRMVSTPRADDRRHATGYSFVAAVGKKLLAMSESAAIGCLDSLNVDSPKLGFQRSPQIDATFAIAPLLQRGIVCEGVAESLEHIRPHFKRFESDAWPNRGDN